MNTNFSLSFHNVDFDITDIHGQPWLRSFQIGSALGYKNPSSDMAKLYDRNADEFTDSMTQVIELPTAGGKQQVRVFSLRGCHLLGMLARTKVAKEFRRWVLDVLEETLLNGKVSDGPAAKTTADTLTPTQIRRVSEAVADLSRISLETTQSVYARLHRRFAVAQTAHIRAADYAEAMRFLGFPDTAPVAPAAPEPGPAIDGAALHGLASMLYYGAWSIEMGKDASEPLRRLGCPKGITMWTVWSETRRLLSQSCRTLETLADMLPADSCHKPYITEALADIRRTAKNCMI